MFPADVISSAASPRREHWPGWEACWPGALPALLHPRRREVGRIADGRSAPGRQPQGGADWWLRYGHADPHKGLTYLDTARAQALYQPLIQLNAQGQTEFVLAESISPRGSTSEWVIRLRPDITFHDNGKPLTSADVISKRCAGS